MVVFGQLDDLMETQISLLTERQLEGRVKDLLDPIGFSCLQRQFPLGAYRLDAVAWHRQLKRLFVVELKTCAYIGSLSQLLLYRSALQKWLVRCNRPEGNDVGALLITTFLDLEVVDTIEALGLSNDVWVRVCIPDGVSLRLVEPRMEEVGSQAWYQCPEKPPSTFEEAIARWRLE